jgi:hypothetical protein
MTAKPCIQPLHLNNDKDRKLELKTETPSGKKFYISSDGSHAQKPRNQTGKQTNIPLTRHKHPPQITIHLILFLKSRDCRCNLACAHS